MQDMPDSFVKDVQAQIRDHHGKLERVVANQLAAAGKLNKKVVRGECCWFLRWVADNQNREKLWWVKGRFLERCGTEAKVRILGKDAPIGRDEQPVPSMGGQCLVLG